MKNQAHMRSTLIFMQSFVSDLSKPISRDGTEQIDYVPTQVFTEYVRHLYRCTDGEHPMGIIYPSARRNGGKSVVLFIENEGCCDEVPSTTNCDTDNPAKYLFVPTSY